ncbi:hypothetical protein ACFLX7_00460 [Chloroflexota bacterium]
MLSKEEKKVFSEIMDGIVEKYIRAELLKPPEARGDAENLSFVFTYINTKNLVKHSNTLSNWTIVIACTSVALIALAIAQIIMFS